MNRINIYKKKDIKLDDIKKVLSERIVDPICFPFDGYLDDRKDDAILTKILFVNYLDSTRIKNRDIDKLKNHISKVLQKSDIEVLRKGELNERYYEIVNKIAFNHGITGIRNGKPTKEYNLPSFASKFCGSHNKTAPFWDNQVSDLLMYLGYDHKYRDYKEYVGALLQLKKDGNFKHYPLRRIEHAMWIISDRAIRP